jgi:hypothetical protein
MTSKHYLNSGRATFPGGSVRSPRAAERSGAVTTSKPSSQSLPIKVKTYSVTVKDGALKIDQQPRKVTHK